MCFCPSLTEHQQVDTSEHSSFVPSSMALALKTSRPATCWRRKTSPWTRPTLTGESRTNWLTRSFSEVSLTYPLKFSNITECGFSISFHSSFYTFTNWRHHSRWPEQFGLYHGWHLMNMRNDMDKCTRSVIKRAENDVIIPWIKPIRRCCIRDLYISASGRYTYHYWPGFCWRNIPKIYTCRVCFTGQYYQTDGGSAFLFLNLKLIIFVTFGL